MSMVYAEQDRQLRARRQAEQERQAMVARRQQNDRWDRGREMFERGLQQQEQQRRNSESATARQLGQQKLSNESEKLGVLSGLMRGSMNPNAASYWPYGGVTGRSYQFGGGKTNRRRM